MYRPRHFAIDDDDALDAVEAFGAAAHLVTAGAGGLDATVLPLLLDRERGVLDGHLARPNPQWRDGPTDALAIFPMGDTYVSPSWYPSKASDPRVVPTWNYEVVHVHGRLTVHEDPAWLDPFLRRLTARHDHTWTVDDAPADHIAKLLEGIVGVSLAITRVEGKAKLSQNRSDEDRAGVARALGDHALAERMRSPLIS